MSGKENRGNKIFAFVELILVISFIFFYASTYSTELHFDSPFTFLQPKPEVSVLVVGDIMLDRNVRNKINSSGFDSYFSGVKELISGADIAVGNLEGPFTSFPSVTASLQSKELKFTFDPNLAPKLSDLGFDILGLANNHSMNFGEVGFAMTKDYLKNAGLFYYGDPNNKDELSTVIEKNGIKVGFVGFHEFTYINFDKVFAEIDRLRPEVDVLIVTPHWGIEYQSKPTQLMKKWSREFIDHGADVVIGSHPHVVGDIEEYNGKKIFYSLGNFAFDQYFSEDTMNGLVVLMQIEKDKRDIKFNLINIRIDKEGPKVY